MTLLEIRRTDYSGKPDVLIYISSSIPKCREKTAGNSAIVRLSLLPARSG